LPIDAISAIWATFKAKKRTPQQDTARSNPLPEKNKRSPLTEMQKQVVTTLEVAGVEAFVQVWPGLPGRPPCDRAALARAFIAKSAWCEGGRSGQYVNLICVIALVTQLFNTEYVIFPSKE
jgi:hypothetical protein